MLDKARDSFERLQRLADPAINAALLAALDARPPSPDHALLRANLLRRSGDLAGARAAFAALCGESALDEWLAVPSGLWSDGDFAVAPLVAIDGFLPPERMAALHAHACEREAEFADAKATNIDALPAYDPERRRSLIDWDFTLERDFFLDFLEQNLARLQACLGLPGFNLERIEIKLTNHVDGGFFKMHCDNRAPIAEAGRAITWLYYFGEPAPRYRGGELYILDSRPAEELLSPAWFTRIAPRPNRLIAFPSWFYHAVAPMKLPEQDFSAGRFAVSSHIRKTGDTNKVWWEKNGIDSITANR